MERNQTKAYSTRPKSPKKTHCFRNFFVGTMLVAWIVASVLIVYRYFTIDRGMSTYPSSEMRNLAITLLFDHFKNIGTVSTALLAAIWGYWLLTKNIRLNTTASLISFGTTTAIFLSSIFTYCFGQQFLLDRMFSYMTIDFEAPMVCLWQQAQFTLFILGILSTITTLIVSYTPPAHSSNRSGT